MVRAMVWPEGSRKAMYLTGGEDGNIAVWRRKKGGNEGRGKKRKRVA